MPHTATSLTSWARAIKTTLDERGHDSSALFASAGLDIAALGDPNARYPLAGTTELWRLAVAATGDDCLGLAVSRNINQTTFHALGYSLMASPTLKEAFERLVRYFRIVTDAGELEFVPEGGHYKFVLHPIEGPVQPAHEASDALVAIVYRSCRLLTGRQFQALKMRFRRPAPADITPFQKVFHAPLEFAAPETAMLMDEAILHEPLANANPELARHNDAILARYLSEFDKQNIANRVHASLVEQLPHGDPSQEKTAAALHMSLRNLQRKLSAEGTSYKEILNQTRRELALSYIDDARYSISEITYLLGFADSSSFTRAFKRWTGVAPKAYRQG